MWTYVVSFLVVNKYGLLYVCYVASLFFVFVLGLLAVTWFFGAEVKRKILYRYDAIPLKPPPNGLSAVFEKLSKLRLTWKIDKRLSGEHSFILHIFGQCVGMRINFMLINQINSECSILTEEYATLCY